MYALTLDPNHFWSTFGVSGYDKPLEQAEILPGHHVHDGREADLHTARSANALKIDHD